MNAYWKKEVEIFSFFLSLVFTISTHKPGKHSPKQRKSTSYLHHPDYTIKICNQSGNWLIESMILL